LVLEAEMSAFLLKVISFRSIFPNKFWCVVASKDSAIWWISPLSYNLLHHYDYLKALIKGCCAVVTLDGEWNLHCLDVRQHSRFIVAPGHRCLWRIFVCEEKNLSRVRHRPSAWKTSPTRENDHASIGQSTDLFYRAINKTFNRSILFILFMKYLHSASSKYLLRDAPCAAALYHVKCHQEQIFSVNN